MFELEKIKDRIISELDSIRSNKKVVYHTSILFGSQIIVILLGFFSKGIQTRALTPENYGLYAFFTTLTSFAILFFNLGLYPTIEVLLASNDDKKKEKELFGTCFTITFFLGVAFSIFLVGLSFFIDRLFHIEFGHLLRLISPLCIFFPFRLLIPALAIGSNKIEHAAWYDVLFQFLFSIALAILFFYSDLDVTEVIVLNLLASIAAIAIIGYAFRPSFKNFISRFKEIWIKNKEFGIHYYWGSIFSETTYKLDEILITFFINTTQLGFYSLANIICTPMVMLSSALSSALFKRFTNENTISNRIFIFNIIWIALSVAVLYFAAGTVISILFGSAFSNVEAYVLPLSVAYIFKTLCQPFAFLTAKGKGKEMRNVALAEGVVSVITNVAFVPLWGVMGAIYASILARAVDFFGLYYYYRKYIGEIKNSPDENSK